jgi:16S rRNA processing protein RimM
MTDNSVPLESSESLRKVGKVTGVHGLKGELYVYIFSKDISWVDGLDEIVFESPQGVRKVCVVESLRPFKDGFLVFIEGVSDRSQAENFRSHLVYVSGAHFETDEDDESFYLAEIEGFKVFDKGTLLGVIEGFSSNTIQDLLLVRMDVGVIQVPLVEDFLVEIKFEEGELYMTLPEGLVEAQREPSK